MYLHRLLNNTQIFVFLNGEWEIIRKKEKKEEEQKRNNKNWKQKEKSGNEWMGQRKKYNALIKALKSP